MARSSDPRIALASVVSSPAVVRVVMAALFVVAAAYFIWFYPTLESQTLRAMQTGNIAGLGRQIGNKISGVTTLTQLGIPLAVVSVYGMLLGRSKSHRVFYRLAFIVLAIFAIYRMFVWSERLALFEILVPGIVAWMLLSYNGQAKYKILPIVGLISIIFIFGFAEYFRSWNYYGSNPSSTGIVSFSLFRFLSYYFSSMNNMALLIDRLDPTYLPLKTLDFFFRIPLPGFGALNELQDTVWREHFMGSLRSFANPEFNLFSAVGSAISDFGVTFGIGIMAVYGWITGILYSSALNGRFLGLIFYPCWMIGLLEFGRLLYWGTGRAFPAWLMAFVLLYVMKYCLTALLRRNRAEYLLEKRFLTNGYSFRDNADS